MHDVCKNPLLSATVSLRCLSLLHFGMRSPGSGESLAATPLKVHAEKARVATQLLQSMQFQCLL